MTHSPSHPPRKRFGQHFLRDSAVIQDIIAAIHPVPDEVLVEIGPGQGALTQPLLEVCEHLTVIELDRDLAAQLPSRVNHPQQLRIVEADALRFDFAPLAETGKPLRVVGNLPYNISTPLLFHLASFHTVITEMLFMLQKEVVERMVAAVATKAYGRLSVMMQYAFALEHLFDVAPSAFFPPPKVDSSIVRLTPYQSLPVAAIDAAFFEKIVAQAFSQRRKTLRNTLKGVCTETDLMAVGINPQVRAECLSVSDFVQLANHLSR